MIKLERILVKSLIIISITMFLLIATSTLLSQLEITFTIHPFFFNQWLTYFFYSLAIGVPLFMFIRWLIKPSIKYFKKTLLTSIPFIVFLIWFITMIISLGESLSHF